MKVRVPHESAVTAQHGARSPRPGLRVESVQRLVDQNSLETLDSAGGMLRSAGRQRAPKLSAEQLSELEEAFNLFDTEGTQSIDYHELKVAMRALGFPVSKVEVRKLAHEYDVENLGRVQYRDFVEIMTSKIGTRDPRDEIQKAFELFDEDGTGRITARNLRRVARELGENIAEDDLQAMIDEFDKNLDGSIDAGEFHQIMTMCGDD